MNLGHPVSTRKLQRKLTLHRRRDDRRVAVNRVPAYGHAVYTYKTGPFNYTAGGLIWDLSGTGCSIRATMPPVVGTKITMVLSLDGDQKPLFVRGAIVAWVTRDAFGIEFPKLKPYEYHQLHKHIRWAETAPSTRVIRRLANKLTLLIT